MPLRCYERKSFRGATLAVIETANAIVDDYAAQGFDLTLRQLYYQFVARGLLPNTEREYKRLGSVISDARLAGLIDWNRIVDRTRAMRGLPHWQGPGEIVEACAEQYRTDRWSGQPTRPEVWIEKDALVGVLVDVCNELDVSFFSCRGYTSQSAMWRAAQRLISFERAGQSTIVLHLGDHDPSGIDMSRDVRERLSLFGAKTRVERIALNMDQVRVFEPPPNPAKLTDSRASDYVAEFGLESWELDALEPATIAGLIREAVIAVRDDWIWREACAVERMGRAQLQTVSDHWDEVVFWLRDFSGGGEGEHEDVSEGGEGEHEDVSEGGEGEHEDVSEGGVCVCGCLARTTRAGEPWCGACPLVDEGGP